MPGKKKTSKVSKVKKAEDVKPLPAMDKKAAASKKDGGLPPLTKSPTIPPKGDKETNEIPLPDKTPPSRTPDREGLHQSLKEISGISAETSGLAEEFMPLLAEKVDTLGQRLDAKFDSFSASLSKVIEKEQTSNSKEFAALRKEITALREVITTEILPPLTTIGGIVAALHKSGGVTATKVAEAQEAEAEILEAEAEDVEDSSDEGESIISPGLQGAFQYYLDLPDLKGQRFDLAAFAEQVLDQASEDPDTELDPDMDTKENAVAYLHSLPQAKGDKLVI